MLEPAFSPFPTMFSKDSLHRIVESWDYVGKSLNKGQGICFTLFPERKNFQSKHLQRKNKMWFKYRNCFSNRVKGNVGIAENAGYEPLLFQCFPVFLHCSQNTGLFSNEYFLWGKKPATSVLLTNFIMKYK